MNEEKKIKVAQLKELKEAIKQQMAGHTGLYSEIKFPDIRMPGKVSQGEAEAIFNELLESFRNRQRGKALTVVKNDKKAAGLIAFTHKVNYLKENPGCSTKLIGFTHQETLSIYQEAMTA